MKKLAPRIIIKNIDISHRFCGNVSFLRYTEMLKFRSQSWKAASNHKPHRGLATR